MTYPLVVDLADEGVPVDLTCRVLGFSRQAFYKWRADPVSQRDWDDAHLLDSILDVHDDDPEFGYRLIADELHRRGFDVGENRVQRLCSEHRIWSTTTRKGRRASGKHPGPAVHDDLVQRDFTADHLDQVWLTDITEHPTSSGKVYVCAVKDVCSNRIVGWATDQRMTASLATAALNTAIARRQPSGATIVHSDRGGQFRSRAYRRVLERHQLAGSMGRVASAADNAAMESFFSLLQKNVLDRHTWTTREDLQIAVAVWIERTYNRRRRQRTLGKLTPVEFELALDHTPHTTPV